LGDSRLRGNDPIRLIPVQGASGLVLGDAGFEKVFLLFQVGLFVEPGQCIFGARERDRLDHAIVAEGVESEQQRDWLVNHGCRYLQGYLFSRAIPRADFLTLSQQRYDTTPSLEASIGF